MIPEGLSERNELSFSNMTKLGLKYLWSRITFRSNEWIFSKRKKSMIFWETPEWKKHYLPFDMKDLTVLDVGAGEGETAKLFLEAGAKEIICIEADRTCFENLYRNASKHNMVLFTRPFLLSDIFNEFDFMKMDIEGYEEALLSVNFDFPCVVEVHGMQLRDRFLKDGYKLADPYGNPYSKYACYMTKNIEEIL